MQVFVVAKVYSRKDLEQGLGSDTKSFLHIKLSYGKSTSNYYDFLSMHMKTLHLLGLLGSR